MSNVESTSSTHQLLERAVLALEGILTVMDSSNDNTAGRAVMALERLAEQAVGPQTSMARKERRERTVLLMVEEDIRTVKSLSKRSGIAASTLRRWDEVRRFCGLDALPELEMDSYRDL